MSRHHIEKVTCPSCHHEGDFELWDSINTALDPEMKEKVLNQSIFLYTCPSCGETFRLNYSTLYHQMEDLVMIYLVPESEVKKTYEIFYEKNALADYRTEKYLYRIVTSANQLVEKIQIFDAGKDDRVMELVKLLATDSILKNDPYIEFDELRFAVDDDGTNILVIINKGEITGAVDIDICMNLLLHTAMISRISAMMRTLLSIGSGSLTNLPKQKTNSIFGGYTPKPL